MPTARRGITRIQDADDAPNLGSAESGKALTWNNGNSDFDATAFEADGAVAAHAAAGDPHTQYLLATGARTGASSQAQNFTNGIIGPSWKPSSDSATAMQLQNAAGASIVNVDTTNKRIGINNSAPNYSLVLASGGTASWMQIVTTNTGATGGDAFYFGVNPSQQAVLWNSENTAMLFYTNNKLSMQLNNVGSLYVYSESGAPSCRIQDTTKAWMYILQTGALSSSNYPAIWFNQGSNWSHIAHDFNGEGLLQISRSASSNQKHIAIDGSGNVGIGQTPASKLDVNGIARADGLRLDVTPTSETITPTHTFTISLNGTDYKVPVVAA